MFGTLVGWAFRKVCLAVGYVAVVGGLSVAGLLAADKGLGALRRKLQLLDK